MAEKVDQDVREAVAEWDWLTEMGSTPEFDAADALTQAFARMKKAGRQQGLREVVHWLSREMYEPFVPYETAKAYKATKEAITALMEGDVE